MKIAFNIEDLRPGCVLIQASLGCLLNSEDRELFMQKVPAEFWITSLEGIKVYDITPQQFGRLVETMKERHQGS